MPFDGAFSPFHWLIIAVVALLVIGPDKLPDAARRAGAAWRDVRSTYHSLLDDARRVVEPGEPADSPVETPESTTPD